MHVFELTVAVVSALAWAYLLFARGGFWRVGQQFAPAASTSQVPVRVAAVIPARNEADVVGLSINSLLQHSGPHLLNIFLVDDASSDGTAQAARDAAAECGRSDLLTVMPGRPLPPGWSGKLWAVHQGVEAARSLDPDYFLLTDADILHAPDNVARLVGVAESGGYNLTSFMVTLHCGSFAEKVLIPAFVYFFFKLYPPSWIAAPQNRTAGAAGGCMLVRPAALARAGGIEGVRGEIIDDCALAQAIKTQGGRIWLGITENTSSLRAYGSFSEIGRMIARTAFNQLGHSAFLLMGTVLGLAVVYLAPPALLFSGSIWPTVLGALTLVAMVVSYVPMVRLYGLNPAWALLLPASAIFYMGATVRSAVDYWFGRGGQWKGRAQDVETVRDVRA